MKTDRLNGEIVDFRFKGMPADADGLTVAELAAQKRSLFDGGFTTPVMTLDAAALEHNLATLGRWAGAHALAIAPHGKTTMAPRLFERQLAHGAWGITAATVWQARVYRSFGVPRIFLANEVTDPAALRWISGQLAADPEFRLIVYVDSVRGVELMDRHLSARLDVVVELGETGGRAGVRDEADADAVAAAVTASRWLRLVGVAGYEGAIAAGDEPGVRAWLVRLVALARRFEAAGLLAGAEEIVISAGGSAWFDTVTDVLGGAADFGRPVLRLLRSGAYVGHDDGHYRQVTPFRERVPGEGTLRPALRLWTHVVSRPEEGLALLNAGKRDAPQDLGMPVPLEVRDAVSGERRPADGLTVARLADQHAFVTVAPGTALAVGDWVCLGVSHPCTAFDKWTLLPELADDGTVTGLVRTFF